MGLFGPEFVGGTAAMAFCWRQKSSPPLPWSAKARWSIWRGTAT